MADSGTADEQKKVEVPECKMQKEDVQVALQQKMIKGDSCFKCHYALERHKNTRSHCMFVLALKQPEVSKPSLQPDSALDTDDGITQGTDEDAGCPSAFDDEDDIAVADCGQQNSYVYLVYFESDWDFSSKPESLWNDDERFQAPMAALPNGEHIFVRDCITFEHHSLGTTKAVIVKFFEKEKMQYFASNEWKEKAGGKKVIMVPLILFTDDTSGNRSKKWNKFESWYLLLAGLGRHANAKPSNIHFLTTSNKVSPLDQSVPIVEELLLLESEGIEAYDAFSDCQVLVVAPLICVICDNPRAKELCNQLASSTRKYCRICMADKIDSPDVIGVPRTRALSLSQMEEISSQTSISRTYNTRVCIAYAKSYNRHLKEQWKSVCQNFIDSVKVHFLNLLRRPKMHLILHLIESFEQYGPTSAFSAERCESFNSDVRAQNIYSNRQAPSRDIGKHFAVLEHVRHIVDGGRYGQESVGALTVSVPGMEKCTLFGLAQHDPPYVLSFHHVQLNDKVTTECRGIVAQSFQLIHTGDYVELDVPCELKFGVLLSVCKLAVGSTVCFIQMFEPLFIRIGEPLLSDTDCPMFELSRNIEAVEGCKVLKAVSFVHDCFSEGCHFEEMGCTQTIETVEWMQSIRPLLWYFEDMVIAVLIEGERTRDLIE
eukprot:Em0014g406a